MQASLLQISQLAAQLSSSNSRVSRLIRKQGIQPVWQNSNLRLYDPSVIPVLAQALAPAPVALSVTVHPQISA